MHIAKMVKRVRDLARIMCQEPRQSMGVIRNLADSIRGSAYAAAWPRLPRDGANDPPQANNALTLSPNPLLQYFDSHKSGRGIWKWRHYFDIYHRHFAKFVGREVHIAEIGVFSGGSLDMWKTYFGPRCHVYGVDIEPACKTYEGDRVKILIGDQANREFWKAFASKSPFSTSWWMTAAICRSSKSFHSRKYCRISAPAAFIFVKMCIGSTTVLPLLSPDWPKTSTPGPVNPVIPWVFRARSTPSTSIRS